MHNPPSEKIYRRVAGAFSKGVVLLLGIFVSKAVLTNEKLETVTRSKSSVGFRRADDLHPPPGYVALRVRLAQCEIDIAPN